MITWEADRFLNVGVALTTENVGLAVLPSCTAVAVNVAVTVRSPAVWGVIVSVHVDLIPRLSCGASVQLPAKVSATMLDSKPTTPCGVKAGVYSSVVVSALKGPDA